MLRFVSLIPKFRRLRLPIILAAITALFVAACNPSNFRTEAAETKPLILSILSDPKTFNYALSQESPNIFPYTFEGLTTLNPLTGEIEPGLAESWEIADDGLRFVFTLRENLKWSDAQPLTAEDVVFSYNDIYFNKEIPTDVKDGLKMGDKGILPKVRKLDERRVEFALPEPFRPFLQNMTTPILPKHALQESVEKKDSEGKPLFLQKWGVDTPVNEIVTNGPYKLGRYNTTQRIVFERNPYYWKKDKPLIDKVNWEIVESQDTSLLQFRSGSLDYIGVTPDYFSLLKREEKRGNFDIKNGGPATGTSFVFFNLNKGSRNGKPLVDPVKSKWFNTKEFRQAVAYAIDRETMINNTFRGLGKKQNSPISVQSPYYLPPEKGLKVYDYNPEKAQELLKKAGFKYNSQGQLLDKDGNRVRFTLLTNSGNKIREAMGAQIKSDLSKIGIQVDFTPLAWNTYLDKISNSLDFEMSLIGLTGGLEPNDGANVWKPEGGLHMFNQKPQAGQKPIEGWEVAPWEKEIARLYVKATQELDEEKVKEIYAETQKITQENLPFIYLVNPLSLGAIRNNIEGTKFNAIGGAFWNIEEVKLTKE
ncbi:ABC-type dipeptide transport system, periplasmic component [Rivularia sp. PCC 7116]|uniref:ABC transporter substrate-binding protein n=1 Tax=Rivularia sp. PCC 7116 TaxID=373994 RepID=UPI00029EDC77|nr:ABC transporter substrate-binding protein [Rivularia sp. PCC 7116]AFY53393.1 ABC-type dipeptide transport system, periplasmic component [Rivularia sp. PCC 7116]